MRESTEAPVARPMIGVKTALFALVGIASPLATASVTIDQTQTFSLQGGKINLSFSGFNTSLGTLTGATVSLNYTQSGGYLGVDNQANVTATIDFDHTTTFLVDNNSLVLDWSNLHGATRLLDYASTQTESMLLGQTVGPTSEPGGGGADYAGSDYIRYNLPTVSVMSSGSFANINQFMDVSPFTVPIKISQSDDTSSDQSVAHDYMPGTVSGSMTITYTYTVTSVPEPRLAVVSGAMLLGALFFRRRR